MLVKEEKEVLRYNGWILGRVELIFFIFSGERIYVGDSVVSFCSRYSCRWIVYSVFFLLFISILVKRGMDNEECSYLYC